MLTKSHLKNQIRCHCGPCRTGMDNAFIILLAQVRGSTSAIHIWEGGDCHSLSKPAVIKVSDYYDDRLMVYLIIGRTGQIYPQLMDSYHHSRVDGT
jgi:hypothetical protein